MSRRDRSVSARATFTIVGGVLAAMVVIAGLVVLAVVIFLVAGMNNFGSNK